MKHTMKNDELAKAISSTIAFIMESLSGTDRSKSLLRHLDILLAEQAERAKNPLPDCRGPGDE